MKTPFERSATCELAIHVAVLLVLTPILMFIFPSFMLLVSATMMNSMATQYSFLTGWIGPVQRMPQVVALVAAVMTAVLALVWEAHVSRRAPSLVLRQPSGRDGDTLLTIVEGQWRRLGKSTPAPVVRWFASMNIAAYAVETAAGAELQISAGLWRAVVSGSSAAEAILAHELAHVVYRDARLLRLIKHINTATRAVILIIAVVSTSTVALILFERCATALRIDQGAWAVGRIMLQTMGIAGIVLILFPLCWLALKRQTALIISLIEIRADIAAAMWTGGLERFTQRFAEQENVVRSTDRDLLSALLSPDLTHIPERERLHILNTPALLITPKLRFYSFSILLVFALPINFATPLLFGGKANYLAMLSLGVSLNVAIVTMLLLGRGTAPHQVPVPIGRSFVLATASCVVGALPRINLEPVSYLVMSWLAGFGGTAMDWGNLINDTAITAHDLATRLTSNLLNPFFMVAVIAAFCALYVIARPPHNWAARPGAWSVALVAAAATIATVVAGADARLPIPLGADNSLESTIAVIGLHQTLYLCLPTVCAAVVLLLGQTIGLIFRRT